MSHLGKTAGSKFTILLIVIVPSKYSPPRNCKTVINSAELKFL